MDSGSSSHERNASLPVSAQSILRNPIFRCLSDVSDDIVLIVGERGQQLIGANRQVSRRLGYAARELRSTDVLSLFADRDAAQKFLRSIWSAGREVAARVSCMHKTGRIIPATVHARVLPESENQLGLIIIQAGQAGEPESRHERRKALLKLLRVGLAAGPLSAPSVEQQVQIWLRHICRATEFPAAHFHLVRNDAPELFRFGDAWHVGSDRELAPIRQDPFRIALPADFHLRIAASRTPQAISGLHSHPQFQAPEIRRLKLSCAVAVPILIGKEVGGVSVFYLTDPLSDNSLLVDIIDLLGRELGHMIHFRLLSLSLAKVQEEERRHLASELHDTVAQSLSILLLDLDAVQQESTSLSSAGNVALARAISLASQSLQEIRTMSYLLHPPVLDALGLVPALRVFIEGFSRRSGMRVTSEMPNRLPRLPQDWEIAVFRVVQEGLTNVQRHSHSMTAEVHLSVVAGTVTVRVINEGATAPPLESGGLPAERAGVGISGMRERVRAFGGDANLYSRGGKTILEASVPLPKTIHSPQLRLRF